MPHLRRFAGTLFILPLVVLFLGGQWEWDQNVHFDQALLLDTSLPPEQARDAAELVVPFHFPDAVDWTYGTVIETGQALEVQLPAAVARGVLEIQADHNDAYVVSGSADGESFTTLWTVPPTSGPGGLATRESPDLQLAGAVRYLRISGQEGDGLYSVAWVQLKRPAAVFRHWWLIPILWGAWSLVMFLRGHRRLRPAADRVLALWAASDLWLSGVLVYLVLFRLPPVVLVSWLLVLMLLGVIGVAKTARPGLVVMSAILVVGLGVGLPWALHKIIVGQIARVHHLTVDHRMIPNPNLDINTDGLRFTGEADDLSAEDFVVLFLGDSFTYGLLLEYEEAYPYRFEARARQRRGLEKLRAVDLGWVSSSPVLNLRLLRDVGHKYRPDLVIYSLDMTDFRDDLHYEYALQTEQELDTQEAALLQQFWAMHLPRFAIGVNDFATILDLVRFTAPSAAPTAAAAVTAEPIPEDRFFITNQPLEQTRHDIERGTMRQLAALHHYVTEELGCRFVLVVYPRAYQYSVRESPDNWEGHCYQPLGPYVREPFRYFAEVRHDLPYPLVDLMPAFENTDEFPLFFAYDPHWNAAGADFAARAVLDSLCDRGLLPARP
jgi:hypothetical protein